MVTQLPEELERRLGQIAVETLKLGFSIDLREGVLTAVDPWTPGNEVTIKLDFHGRRLSGWVSVDTTVALLSCVWRAMLGDKRSLSLREARDLAGEIANQLVGRMKSSLLDLDGSLLITLSTPNVLSEEEREGLPTILIPLQDESGELHVIYFFRILDWPKVAEGSAALDLERARRGVTA